MKPPTNRDEEVAYMVDRAIGRFSNPEPKPTPKSQAEYDREFLFWALFGVLMVVLMAWAMNG